MNSTQCTREIVSTIRQYTPNVPKIVGTGLGTQTVTATVDTVSITVTVNPDSVHVQFVEMSRFNISGRFDYQKGIDFLKMLLSNYL